MTGEKINCIGCGRTDAGVHASQFFCHIKVDHGFDFDPVFRLNKMLPNDISIFDIIQVDRSAHAQHDAVARTYTYRVHTKKNAFKSELSTFYPKDNLNPENMRKALSLLRHYRDFRSMCKQPDLYKSTICQISQSALVIDDHQDELKFEITADRFLRGMIRILVGNVLEIGYGRLALSNFEECLKTGQPTRHFKAAYPQGLYLSKVAYPYLNLAN